MTEINQVKFTKMSACNIIDCTKSTTIKNTIFTSFVVFVQSIYQSSTGANVFSNMFNMLQVNPAYAGNRVVGNITAVYRNQ